MAVSTDFIIGLVFNLVSLVITLVAMWQTQKVLSLRQCSRYRLQNDIEAVAPSSSSSSTTTLVHARFTERAPSLISTKDEEQRTEDPPAVIAPHPAKPLNALVKENSYDSDMVKGVETLETTHGSMPRAVPKL